MTIVQAELLGFVELRVGSMEVRVPVRKAPDHSCDSHLAKFAMEGNSYAILVKEKDESAPMLAAVEQACEDAVRQLSKKLLN
ncbi:MAG: hypothetical protein HOW73_21090 [Polyangiaceae bacterium]|nr:hypothetical protein [Polyangiaceae bacterium]